MRWPLARIEIGYLWLVYAGRAFGANLFMGCGCDKLVANWLRLSYDL